MKGSARDLHELRESSEWEVGISRHQCRATLTAFTPAHGGHGFKLPDSGRVGGQYFQTLVPSSSQCVTPTHGKSTVRSIRTLGKASGGMCLGRRKAAGREEPRDPRALESLVVVSGVGERHVTSRHVTSRHVTSRHVTSRTTHGTECRVTVRDESDSHARGSPLWFLRWLMRPSPQRRHSVSSLRPSFEDREFIMNSDGQEPAALFFSERNALTSSLLDDQGMGLVTGAYYACMHNGMGMHSVTYRWSSLRKWRKCTFMHSARRSLSSLLNTSSLDSYIERWNTHGVPF